MSPLKVTYGDYTPSCKCDPSCIALRAAQRMAIIIHDEVEHDSDGKEGLTITCLREDIAMYAATLIILTFTSKCPIHPKPVIIVIIKNGKSHYQNSSKKKSTTCFPRLKSLLSFK